MEPENRLSVGAGTLVLGAGLLAVGIALIVAFPPGPVMAAKVVQFAIAIAPGSAVMLGGAWQIDKARKHWPLRTPVRRRDSMQNYSPQSETAGHIGNMDCSMLVHGQGGAKAGAVAMGFTLCHDHLVRALDLLHRKPYWEYREIIKKVNDEDIEDLKKGSGTR